jgi:hypothetical protein
MFSISLRDSQRGGGADEEEEEQSKDNTRFDGIQKNNYALIMFDIRRREVTEG